MRRPAVTALNVAILLTAALSVTAAGPCRAAAAQRSLTTAHAAPITCRLPRRPVLVKLRSGRSVWKCIKLRID